MEYYLVRQEIDGKGGFKFLDLEDGNNPPQNIIDDYKLFIEAEGIEIFEVKGCQIMTEKGIYIVARKDQIIKTVFLNVEP